MEHCNFNSTSIDPDRKLQQTGLGPESALKLPVDTDSTRQPQLLQWKVGSTLLSTGHITQNFSNLGQRLRTPASLQLHQLTKVPVNQPHLLIHRCHSTRCTRFSSLPRLWAGRSSASVIMWDSDPSRVLAMPPPSQWPRQVETMLFQVLLHCSNGKGTLNILL